jgi:hypothetical protein
VPVEDLPPHSGQLSAGRYRPDARYGEAAMYRSVRKSVHMNEPGDGQMAVTGLWTRRSRLALRWAEFEAPPRR